MEGSTSSTSSGHGDMGGKRRILRSPLTKAAASPPMASTCGFIHPPASATTTSAGKVSSQQPSQLDETGIGPTDIALVRSQAKCSREDAIKALKNNDNDIVSAIVEVTMKQDFG